MPYPRNPQREEKLNIHYIMGHTIKETSIMTGIPAGTISYYFAKFKKSPEFYLMRQNVQTPPRNKEYSEEKVYAIAYAQNNLFFLINTVGPLIRDGEFTKARAFLESMKILHEFEKEIQQIVASATPEEREKASKMQVAAIVEWIKGMGRAQRTITKPDLEEETSIKAPEGIPQDIPNEAFSSRARTSLSHDLIQYLSINNPELIRSLQDALDLIPKVKSE